MSISQYNDSVDDLENLNNSDCSDVINESNCAPRESDHVNSSQASCWIFGYGSLCWNPGFEYDEYVIGYIRNYVRRFWQGNTTHRGTPEKPGRVATIIELKGGITWGCAYKITGQRALDYLKQRECTLGDYNILELEFYPRVNSYDTTLIAETFKVLVYIAYPQSKHWLGEDTLDNVAKQIIECCGPSGSNTEYVLRLAKFMREQIPNALDEHLFQLESLILMYMSDRGLKLPTVLRTDSVISLESFLEEKHVNYPI